MPLYGYELCHPIVSKDFEAIRSKINGKHLGSDWQPISVKIIKIDDGKSLKTSDSPWIGSNSLIFRSKSLGKIEYLLCEHGELLPLHCFEEKLVIFNPTKIINALDESSSSVYRFDDGRIFGIKKYEFVLNTIKNIHIFKIPNLLVSPTFVSDKFVEEWKAMGFKGIFFEKVWSSEEERTEPNLDL